MWHFCQSQGFRLLIRTLTAHFKDETKKHFHINSNNKRMNREIFSLEAKFPSNSSNGNESSLRPTRQHQYKIDAFKFLFGSIAALSFLGNLLLSMAICKRRQLLLKTYNLLVLNLAITDMLTGLFRVRVSVCCYNWLHGLIDEIFFWY